MRGLEPFFRVVKVVAFFVLLWLSVMYLVEAQLSYVILAIGVVTGLMLADLASGLVHWAADSWGSERTPILGKYIYPFREHHVDQTAITHHDFFYTNANNCFICIPLLAVVPYLENDLLVLLTASTTAWVFLTNQFHKWAHQTENTQFVKWLQRKRIILSPEHHAMHHATPHNSHYCITTGWCNGILAKLGVFRKMERVITAVTKMQPH